MKVRTSGGYTVEEISTVDRGTFYSVKDRHNFTVQLEPWISHSHAEIRTWEQLTAVLAREGQEVPGELSAGSSLIANSQLTEGNLKMRMLTADRRFEVEVLELNGKDQFRLRELVESKWEWRGNFTDVNLLFGELRKFGGDPATLKEEPCPLHSECERYLPASECPYRSGKMTFAEAENAASDQSGLGGPDGFAANE